MKPFGPSGMFYYLLLMANSVCALSSRLAWGCQLLKGGKKGYDDALIGYGKALSIRLRVLGENSYDVNVSHHSIGQVLKFKGQNEQALESFRKAQLIFLCDQGEDHINTVVCNKSINQVLQKLKEKEDEENKREAEEKNRQRKKRKEAEKNKKEAEQKNRPIVPRQIRKEMPDNSNRENSYFFQIFLLIAAVVFSYYYLALMNR